MNENITSPAPAASHLRYQIIEAGLDEHKAVRRTIAIYAQLEQFATALTKWTANCMKPEEQAVALLLGEGLVNKEVASRLRCSMRTVEARRSRALLALSKALQRTVSKVEFLAACYMIHRIAGEEMQDFSVESVLVNQN